MKKKIFIAGMTVNLALAGVLTYSIYNTNRQVNELRTLSERTEDSVKSELNHINQKLIDLNSDISSIVTEVHQINHKSSMTEAVTVHVESARDENSEKYKEEYQVLTKEEVMDLLKLDGSDKEEILDSIDHVVLNDEVRFLKKDVLRWLDNEINSQTNERLLEYNINEDSNYLTIDELSALMGIPAKDIDEVLSLYPESIPCKIENELRYFSKDEVERWRADEYNYNDFKLKTYEEDLTWGSVARYLDISMEKVQELMDMPENPLPNHKSNGLLRFDRTAVDSWLGTVDIQSLDISVAYEMGILDYIKYQDANPKALLIEICGDEPKINYKIIDGRMVFNRDNKK